MGYSSIPAAGSAGASSGEMSSSGESAARATDCPEPTRPWILATLGNLFRQMTHEPRQDTEPIRAGLQTVVGDEIGCVSRRFDFRQGILQCRRNLGAFLIRVTHC